MDLPRAARQHRHVLVEGLCGELQTFHRRHRYGKIVDLKRIEHLLADTAAQFSGDEVLDCSVLETLTS